MRKNIVVSMLVIALAAALLGGATWAWFTDSKEANANFTAGTLVLGDIDDFTGSITDWAPGDTKECTVKIKNNGSLAMYYRLYFTSNISGNLPEVVLVSIDDGDEKLLSEVNCDSAFTYSDSSLAGEAEISHTLKFHLPEETNNDYQDAVWTITLHAEAVQAANQGSSVDWGN